MRVDCYNASECPISSIQYGDTFYHNATLYLKVNVDMKSSLRDETTCWAVDLSDGMLMPFGEETSVILADTKVVVNTEDIQF